MSDDNNFDDFSFPSFDDDKKKKIEGSELSVANNNIDLDKIDWDFSDSVPKKKETFVISIPDSITSEISASSEKFDLDIEEAANAAEALVVSENEPKTISVNSIKAEASRKRADLPDASKAKREEEARKNRKKTIKRRVILGVVGALVGLIIGVVVFLAWYKHYLYTRMEILPSSEATIVDESGNTVNIADLTEETEFEIIEADHVHNFLLIGIDSRSSGRQSWGNSDVNMIMSIDDNAGTIKMISIARDSYAYVPGYSNPMKINAAMAYGGPELLKATIENTLRISIDGYAFVNFYNMSGVIDAVGGVYVYASDAEVYAEHGLNWNLQELNELQGLAPDYQAVNGSGNIWLNGRQAVAYARIRYVGNGDYERSERQVEVLRSLLSQFSNLSVAGKAAAIDDILGLISTNISEDDVTTYAFDFLPSMRNVEIQYLQLPIQGCFNSGMYGSEWSIRPNWNAMIPYVQEFFYGEQREFDEVREIPSSPDYASCPSVDDVNLEDLIH